MHNMDVKSSGSNVYLYLTTCTANLAAIAAGCTMVWSSPTLPEMECKKNNVLELSSENAALIGSLLPLGATFGPVINILLIDRIGRKFGFIVYVFMLLVSWVMLAVSHQLEIMLAARFLAGMAVGLLFVLIPLYVSEISSTETRGITGSFFLFFIYLGYCIEYYVGPIFKYLIDFPTSYLILIIVSACVSLFSIIIIFLQLPESPYHLIRKGYKAQAFSVLQRLRGSSDTSNIQREVDEIERMLNESYEKNSNKKLVKFFKWGNMKCFYYSCMLVFFQQASGFNAVTFYTEKIFKDSGSSDQASIFTMICGTIMLFSSAVIPIMSKISRRKYILYFSAIGCALFLSLLWANFYLKQYESTAPGLKLLPIVSIIGYLISFTLGLGVYVWVIIAEIFPIEIKVIGSVMVTSFCWFLCFLITRYFSSLNDWIGIQNTFAIFMIFCLLAFIFFALQLPDTQDLSLQEIQNLIQGLRTKSSNKKDSENTYL